MASTLHYRDRLKRLTSFVEDSGSCALVSTRESNVFYFTGYSGAGFLVATPNTVYLVVPVLEYLNASRYLEESGMNSYVELVVYTPYGLPERLVVEKEGFKLVKGRLPDIVVELTNCENCLVDISSAATMSSVSSRCRVDRDVSSVIAEWRMIKDAWEVERIAVASRITESAVMDAVNSLDRGVSEAELAGLIYERMRRLGASDYAFPPIVAFGDNTVYPHATPSLYNRIHGPTVVLIDAGARYEGYCSDMTRTLFFGSTPPEFRHIAEGVLEAMNTALEKVEPGVKVGEVDAAARRVLEKHGLAKFFIHSLGHGVGIDIHEQPRIAYGSEVELKPGMVITIEPGVYIPGRFGVRIEDTVLVTERGAKRLTRLERQLW